MDEAATNPGPRTDRNDQVPGALSPRQAPPAWLNRLGEQAPAHSESRGFSSAQKSTRPHNVPARVTDSFTGLGQHTRPPAQEKRVTGHLWGFLCRRFRGPSPERNHLWQRALMVLRAVTDFAISRRKRGSTMRDFGSPRRQNAGSAFDTALGPRAIVKELI